MKGVEIRMSVCQEAHLAFVGFRTHTLQNRRFLRAEYPCGVEERL